MAYTPKHSDATSGRDPGKYLPRHAANGGRHRDPFGDRSATVGYNARHARKPPEPSTKAGRHRDPSGARKASMGAVTPSHGHSRKSGNKRAASSLKTVRNRQPGLGQALEWLWKLGSR